MLTVIIRGLQSLSQHLQKWLWWHLALTVRHDLRFDAYCHIQELDMACFHEQSTEGLMADSERRAGRKVDWGAR